MNILPHS
jgi:hypothetical protein